jgi:hypothetical protein
MVGNRKMQQQEKVLYYVKDNNSNKVPTKQFIFGLKLCFNPRYNSMPLVLSSLSTIASIQ